MSIADPNAANLNKLQRKIDAEIAHENERLEATSARAAPNGGSAKQAFAALNLRKEVLHSILAAGYEKPTPIQSQTIPHVLAGRDLLGQAETGSGKTAAFACPLLSMIDLKIKQPQVLILAPTRELAIQVTAAVETYAAGLPGFRALTIYGGQSYDIQLTQLNKGVQVVVGTPGRVMDHMRRGTLKLNELKCLVLDEADEMLRMGFVDDVEWILTKTPQQRQILLFSATLPEPIRRIASQHLKDPQHITVKGRNMTADAIQQSFVETAAKEKIEVLIRILASEPTDGVIVFVRTRSNTVEIAEKLSDAGYSASSLNGDMPQSLRERTVQNFRSAKLAVLVATDVAARGLDVNRVSHVINYDFPNDFESYVHRIGRTGRAGRTGHAILFVGHREKGQLRRLEGATGQRLQRMDKPSIGSINDKRIARFKQNIIDTATHKELHFFADLVQDVATQSEFNYQQIAAALAQLVHADAPLLLRESSGNERRKQYEASQHTRVQRESATQVETTSTTEHRARRNDSSKRQRSTLPTQGLRAYRVEVGRAHEVEAKNIVGAIANESSLDSAKIGRITIHEMHSIVELPSDLDANFFRSLNGVRIAGQQLRLAALETTKASKLDAMESERTPQEKEKGKDKGSERGKSKDKDHGKASAKAAKKPKPKSKRKNKDKGKRRKPTTNTTD
jgi:ATP-dependent RNA helicase DeaD